jgi:hypothetical protein
MTLFRFSRKIASRLSVMLFSALFLAGCHATKSKEPLKEPVVVNEETVVALAKRIEKGILDGNAAALDSLIDKQHIKRVVSENSIVYSGFDVEGGQQYFDDCLKLGSQHVKAVNNGGDFAFVRHYTDEGKHHVVFRTYDSFSLNFSDFTIDTANGKMMLEDGFIYNTGSLLSGNIEKSMLYNLMLKTAPDGATQWLYKAEELLKEGKFRESLQLLTAHKPEIKDYPLFYQLYIADLYKTAPANFINNLDQLKEDADPRYLLLHKLLYYFNNGKVKETEKTVNELITYTGDDPIYLLFYAKANIYAKRYADALSCLEMAEKALPLLWDLWYSELQCYKGLKDESGFQNCLLKGKEAYGMSDEELRQVMK